MWFLGCKGRVLLDRRFLPLRSSTAMRIDIWPELEALAVKEGPVVQCESGREISARCFMRWSVRCACARTWLRTA